MDDGRNLGPVRIPVCVPCNDVIQDASHSLIGFPQNRFLLPNTGANYRYKRGRWMCGVEI